MPEIFSPFSFHDISESLAIGFSSITIYTIHFLTLIVNSSELPLEGPHASSQEKRKGSPVDSCLVQGASKQISPHSLYSWAQINPNCFLNSITIFLKTWGAGFFPINSPSRREPGVSVGRSVGRTRPIERDRDIYTTQWRLLQVLGSTLERMVRIRSRLKRTRCLLATLWVLVPRSDRVRVHRRIGKVRLWEEVMGIVPSALLSRIGQENVGDQWLKEPVMNVDNRR